MVCRVSLFCTGTKVSDAVLNQSAPNGRTDGDKSRKLSSTSPSVHEESTITNPDVTMDDTDSNMMHIVERDNKDVNNPSLKIENVFALEDNKPVESESVNGFEGFRHSVNLNLTQSTKNDDKDHDTHSNPPILLKESIDSDDSRDNATNNQLRNERAETESGAMSIVGKASLSIEEVFAVEDDKPVESESMNGFKGFRNSFSWK